MPTTAFCHCDKDDFTSQRGLTACLPLEKEAKSGYHTAQDGIAFTVVHQTTTRKDLQLRQTQIAPTLRNRRVIAKNTELNQAYLRNTTDAVSCSTKNGGAVREDDLRYTPTSAKMILLTTKMVARTHFDWRWVYNKRQLMLLGIYCLC
jgi:hypothetical protein